jgi:hypothetical protein
MPAEDFAAFLRRASQRDACAAAVAFLHDPPEDVEPAWGACMQDHLAEFLHLHYGEDTPGSLSQAARQMQAVLARLQDLLCALRRRNQALFVPRPGTGDWPDCWQAIHAWAGLLAEFAQDERKVPRQAGLVLFALLPGLVTGATSLAGYASYLLASVAALYLGQASAEEELAEWRASAELVTERMLKAGAQPSGAAATPALQRPAEATEGASARLGDDIQETLSAVLLDLEQETSLARSRVVPRCRLAQARRGDQTTRLVALLGELAGRELSLLIGRDCVLIPRRVDEGKVRLPMAHDACAHVVLDAWGQRAALLAAEVDWSWLVEEMRHRQGLAHPAPRGQDPLALHLPGLLSQVFQRPFALLGFLTDALLAVTGITIQRLATPSMRAIHELVLNRQSMACAVLSLQVAGARSFGLTLAVPRDLLRLAAQRLQDSQALEITQTRFLEHAARIDAGLQPWRDVADPPEPPPRRPRRVPRRRRPGPRGPRRSAGPDHRRRGTG